MNRWVILLLLLVVGFGGFMFFGKDRVLKEGEAVATVAVTDGQGKTVSVPAKPQRVVIISASALDMYIDAGGADTVVGHSETRIISEEKLSLLNKDVEVLGLPSNVSLEKILSLKPDLVIGVDTPFHKRLEGSLEQAKVPLVLFDARSVEDITSQLKLFGQLTGKEDLANQEAQRIESAIKNEQERIKNKPQKRILMVWGNLENFTMVLPNSLQGDLLSLTNSINVAEETFKNHPKGDKKSLSFVPFSLEFAAQENPDFIFFMGHGNPERMAKHMQDSLAKNEAWQVIPAIREGRWQVLPYELFAVNPGTRIDESFVYLSTMLYPVAEE